MPTSFRGALLGLCEPGTAPDDAQHVPPLPGAGHGAGGGAVHGRLRGHETGADLSGTLCRGGQLFRRGGRGGPAAQARAAAHHAPGIRHGQGLPRQRKRPVPPHGGKRPGPHKPRLYVACGTEDFLFGHHKKFVPALEKNGWDVTHEETPALATNGPTGTRSWRRSCPLPWGTEAAHGSRKAWYP